MTEAGAVPSVFVTRRIPSAGLDVLRRASVPFEIGHDDPGTAAPRAVLLGGVARHQVLLCTLTERIDVEVLDHSPRLRGIAQMAVGVDNIDVAAAAARRIAVANTPGVLTGATADLTFALLLAAARRIPAAHDYTVAGRFRAWGPELFVGAGVGPGPDGRRKTLGVVGLGRIGRAVVRRAHGFELDVLAATPRAADALPGVTVVPLEDLLARSHFVSLHCPLTPATHHLIGARELRRMRPDAVLVNTSRGAVVDEHALVRALREGWIAGAGLDVFEREPELEAGLRELDNVVLLPHIGSGTRETRDAMAVLAAEAALAFVRGQRPRHVVEPGRLPA
ncbi:MAG: D-glycerate dehydrogenase [Planctomycetes bacterium]|nr:D-glycerate dehydrogenase [Planctomycetota bacterium]